MSNFGTRIKTLCIAKGITQKELAEALGVTRQSLYLWTKGERMPDKENLQKIANYFNVSLDSLVGDNDGLKIEEKKIDSFISGESPLPDDVVSISEYRLKLSAGNRDEEPLWEELNDVNKVWYRREFFVDRRVNPEKCKRATVYGNSMEPLLHDGDKILFVETPQGTPIRDGNVYIISINGALKVKRLSQKTDGTIVIKSDNPAYQEETVDENVSGFYVLGRVLEVTHQL